MTDTLHDVLEATWPPAARVRVGPWMIRDGQGGGKRVSAATLAEAGCEPDIVQAEQAMRELGQEALFMIRAGDERLDAALDARGYRLVDPTVFYAAPVEAFAPPPSPMAAFAHWPPLAIASAIWREAGIGAARQAVMHRVAGPHAAILGRTQDRPSGAAFVAAAGKTAMVHALEVPADQRRRGAAGAILRRAAAWAGEVGADRLALAVTGANTPARALYASLGMVPVGQYHYRMT